MSRPRKLTPEQERELYGIYKKGELPLAEIAYNFKVSVTTVLRVVERIQNEKSTKK